MKKYIYHISALLLAAFLSLPLLAQPAAALEDPVPLAGAAILVDGDHGDILYEHNGYEKMYPASITKIMTTLVVLEAVEEGKLALTDEITASVEAVTMPEDSSNVGIKAGEILTVEQLLYCDLVASANEACNILAEAVAGSIPDFVELMNKKARALGMTGTHFDNPHGLHSEEHYTTAYDITIMSRAAMEHELFRTMAATVKHEIPATNMSEPRTLRTTNALLSNWTYLSYVYPKAIGIKTGTTNAAGKCLASAAIDDDGRTYYCVILAAEPAVREDGSAIQTQFSESQRLLEWGFDNFARQVLLDDTSYINEIPVTMSDEADHVVIQPVGSIEATMPIDYDPDKAEISVRIPDVLEAPVEKGTSLGSITVSYEGEVYGTLELVAADGVARSDFQYYTRLTKEYFSLWWVKALLVLAVVLAVLIVLQRLLYRPRGRHYSASGGQRRKR